MDDPSTESLSPDLVELRSLREQIKRPLANLPSVRYPLPVAVNPFTILTRPFLLLAGAAAVMAALIYTATRAPGAINFAWGQIAVLCWAPILIGGAMALVSAWRHHLFNQQLQKLASSPTRTRGLVFQLWKEGPDRDIPCILFGFLARKPNGEEEQVNIGETVPPEHFHSLTVNQAVDVAYLPESPVICRVLYN